MRPGGAYRMDEAKGSRDRAYRMDEAKGSKDPGRIGWMRRKVVGWWWSIGEGDKRGGDPLFLNLVEQTIFDRIARYLFNSNG